MWIYENQLGRRNLTDSQRSYLRGFKYNALKMKHGGDRKSSGNNCHLKTSKKVAEEEKVSERTVRNDEKYSESVDKIGEVCSEEVKQKILADEIRITKGETTLLNM